MGELNLEKWELREIKSEPLTEDELEELYNRTKSYEVLFSKRSTEIRKRGLDVKTLTEQDFKNLLLSHYSFLKRPIFLTDEGIFIGNAKKIVELLKEHFGNCH